MCKNFKNLIKRKKVNVVNEKKISVLGKCAKKNDEKKNEEKYLNKNFKKLEKIIFHYCV